MGKHYGLFTDRIEAVVPERSSEGIQIELEAKLQQFLLPENGRALGWRQFARLSKKVYKKRLKAGLGEG